MNSTWKPARVPQFVLFILFFCWPFLSTGQTPGITDKEIVIGSCAALEGPSNFLGRETVAGAEASFASINDEGGVNGRKLH